jgi:hypothetical protein
MQATAFRLHRERGAAGGAKAAQRELREARRARSRRRFAFWASVAAELEGFAQNLRAASAEKVNSTEAYSGPAGGPNRREGSGHEQAGG